ncbi:MAG TPA: GNAT family N-acetyltransferase [Polyangiaceae bacterium]|nr:GNAT family N-acetyltransferase [Polyangiaceae bacterium]
MALSYAPADHDDDRSALGKILGVSFGFDPEASKGWFEKAGFDNVRVLRDESGIIGGLLLIPMGQFFGGRSVPMVGFAGVGVTPSARGTGAATQLMHHAIRELAAQRVPLSCLYPATLPLYRRAGYEIAGSLHVVTLQGRDLARSERSLAIRAFEPADEAAVQNTYRSYAALRDGWLDRGPYVWERTRRVENGAMTHGHVFCDESGIEGYVFYRHRRTDHGFDLQISDMAAATPRALSTLFAFIADHRSLAETVSWRGGVDEPLLMLFREHRYQMRFFHHWMLRIVDVEAALTRRGYAPSIDGEITLVIDDDLVPDNAGAFVLRVAGGAAEVVRGESGSALKLDIRALASLYSGQHNARTLARLGRVEASDETLARAAAMFAGSPPSMADMF